MTGRKAYLVGREKLRSTISEAANASRFAKHTPQFLNSEWEHVIDAWPLEDLVCS
ncbi:hypothetical protein D9M70_396010 [compost metagenome]